VALGVEAGQEDDQTVVDPEALVALTAEIGAADVRLLDVSTDWCVAYGNYINGSRLKRVASEIQSPTDLLGTFAATVSAAGGPRWSMATQPRPDYVYRRKARLETAEPRARLRIRLRAAFGVNARADILAALLARPSDVRIADLARTTRFTKENVTMAVDALQLAGLLSVKSVANERRVSLATKSPLLPRLRGTYPQPDWTNRFKSSLVVLRFLESSDDLTSSTFAIEAARIAASIRDELDTEAAPMPRADARGMEFLEAFQRWLVYYNDWLRQPG
jgi:hypothetical protein